MPRVLVVGPTSRPWDEIADEVAADLVRLRRPGLELEYRCTGTGPLDIRSSEDAAAAAPGVIDLARSAAAEGFDGVVVDCTEDPGVAAADDELDIPVVGPGQALRAVAVASPEPVVWLSGDELRAMATEDAVELVASAATVVLGGTGWSHVAERLHRDRPDLVVLDPLQVALDECLARIAQYR